MPSDPQAAVSRAIAKQQEEPLIINGDAEAQTKAKGKVSYRSLPNKKQLAILCIARLADPLAASSIQVRTTRKRSSDSNKKDIHVLSTPVLQSFSFRVSYFYPGWHYCWV
jgi:hypothetical protein